MDDKSKDWVDFAKAKAVRFEVALEALGLLGSLRRDGEQLQGVCPLRTRRPATKRASACIQANKRLIVLPARSMARCWISSCGARGSEQKRQRCG
jgi:hypothetical protein